MKKCSKCKETKELSLFYKDSHAKDNLKSYCKKCSSMMCYKYELLNKTNRKVLNKININNGSMRKSITKWNITNPLKQKAHRLLNYALKLGTIEKHPCFECGEIKVEAHHCAYDLPLAVTWLCHNHHMQVHREFNNINK
jgi:hypothetical protein